jgi:hypothetical protein
MGIIGNENKKSKNSKGKRICKSKELHPYAQIQTHEVHLLKALSLKFHSKKCRKWNNETYLATLYLL